MTNWTNTELEDIGNANLMVLETAQPDGTPRKPVIVWAVRVGNELFIRSVRGTSGAWYRAIQNQPVGRIQSGGIERQVCFAPTATPPSDAIDAAYREKFGRGSAVDSITAPAAQSATIRLVPHSAD
ncbi:MAG: DUF2255 family protein [Thermomicrobiales bacterium]